MVPLHHRCPGGWVTGVRSAAIMGDVGMPHTALGDPSGSQFYTAAPKYALVNGPKQKLCGPRRRSIVKTVMRQAAFVDCERAITEYGLMSDLLAGRIGFDVVGTGKGVGAEVRGIDLRTLDDQQFADLHQAWLHNLVLLVRNQSLSDADLIAFSRRFGELDLAPIQETGRRFVEGLPELYVVSNVVEGGVPIGSLGNGEAVWHTDMSYVEVPPQASALYALEVPPTGGDTSFVDMYAVYEALPDDLKARIAERRVKHDGTYNSGGFLRQGVTPSDDPRKAPGSLHPLVYTHPETGRPALYLGRRRNAYIDGLDLAESEALLDELWGHVDGDRFGWSHRWRKGDLVLWDNRCTMHRRDAFDPAARRVMHRTQIKGTGRPA
jgi:taurine dioxygenase